MELFDYTFDQDLAVPPFSLDSLEEIHWHDLESWISSPILGGAKP